MTRSRSTYRSSSDGAGCAFTAFFLYFLLILAFWAGVGYVALHFIQKFW